MNYLFGNSWILCSFLVVIIFFSPNFKGACSATKNIRVIDGKDTEEVVGPQSSTLGEDFYSWERKSNPPALRGPQVLLALNKECFSTESHRYIFKLCPFQNVTRIADESRYGMTSGVVLGVWSGWEHGEQVYSGGSDCSYTYGESETYSTRVILECGKQDFKLEVQSEDESYIDFYECNNVLKFHLPIPCEWIGDLSVYEGLETPQQVSPEVSEALQMDCCSCEELASCQEELQGLVPTSGEKVDKQSDNSQEFHSLKDRIHELEAEVANLQQLHLHVNGNEKEKETTTLLDSAIS